MPAQSNAKGRDLGRRTRELLPLTTVAIALALALLVFPSALTLPNPDPAETLEYAPVPPQPGDPPPPDGDLSTLSLGQSSSVTGDGTGGGSAPGPGVGRAPGLIGVGANPSNKRCVGNPPRQTEDPLSPPCVAFFRGDNHGATYQGVTRDEIRLLMYLGGNIVPSSSTRPTTPTPTNAYYDLFEAARDDEPVYVKNLRGWQRYFNDRFQTYGRVVHFFVYFDGGGESPEARRADAAENFALIRPFAVVTDIPFRGNEEVYVEEMARRGVLNFGSLREKSEQYFRNFARLIWGYEPPIEYHAELYSSFVCQKIIGRPVVISGNREPDLDNGSPRRLGLFHTTDQKHPGLVRLAELVREKVEACGGRIVHTATFPECCLTQDRSTDPTGPAANMAAFRDAGVTTILWPGGTEHSHAEAGVGMGYLPEWIVHGAGALDGTEGHRLTRRTTAFDDRAVVVTPEVLHPAFEQQPCYQYFREADRQMARNDVIYACPFYRLLFQVFSGIQVAGPRLGPASVDEGFHAIPRVHSKNPQTPACFYLPGDYTCVKDAQFEIWDAQGVPPGDNRPGCWRVFRGAARYLPGQWPEGNLDSDLPHVGQCNGTPMLS